MFGVGMENGGGCLIRRLFNQDWVRTDEMGLRIGDVVLEVGGLLVDLREFGNMEMKLFQFGLDLVGTPSEG